MKNEKWYQHATVNVSTRFWIYRICFWLCIDLTIALLFAYKGSTRSENVPRISIDIRRIHHYDRALILKSRSISRRNSITDLTTTITTTGARHLVLDPKKNPFKLKGRRKSFLGTSTYSCREQAHNEPPGSHVKWTYR